MKKQALLLAALLVMGGVLAPLSAKDKKEKKPQPVAEKPTLELKSHADTLSYVAGMSLTNGLLPYLKQQFGVSEADMPNFIKGYTEAVSHLKDAGRKAYVAGMQIAQMVNDRMLPSLKADFAPVDSISDSLVYAGFEASLRNDTTKYTSAKAMSAFQEYRAGVEKKKNDAVKAEGEKFLAENAKKPGVVTLPDGLQYKIITKGTGAIPKATDKVEVVYEGKRLDGVVFDATSRHGRKSDVFEAGRLIKGWTEALTMMPVGSKWELYIPYDLAYGTNGAGRDIRPYETLVFTLELVKIDNEAPQSTGAPTKSAAKPVVPTAKKRVAPAAKTPAKKRK